MKNIIMSSRGSKTIFSLLFIGIFCAAMKFSYDVGAQTTAAGTQYSESYLLEYGVHINNITSRDPDIDTLEAVEWAKKVTDDGLCDMSYWEYLRSN